MEFNFVTLQLIEFCLRSCLVYNLKDTVLIWAAIASWWLKHETFFFTVLEAGVQDKGTIRSGVW